MNNFKDIIAKMQLKTPHEINYAGVVLIELGNFDYGIVKQILILK